MSVRIFYTLEQSRRSVISYVVENAIFISSGMELALMFVGALKRNLLQVALVYLWIRVKEFCMG